MATALKRLRAVAFDDGMLPEAYSVTTEPDVRVRHWFAWPGAAVGSLLILDARGDLETVLRASAEGLPRRSRPDVRPRR